MASITLNEIATVHKPARIRVGLPTNLRSVLVAAFVLLSIAPIALALTVAILRTSDQARQQVAAQMNSVLQLKISALESDIGNAQNTLRTISGNRAASTAMIDLLNAPDDALLQASVEDHLSGFLNTQDTQFTEYYVYDANGAITASTSDRQIGKIVRAQPYFAPSLEGEYIQPPYYEVGSNSLAVIMTIPLKDEQGHLIGVLAGRLNMDDLAAVMSERAGLGESGETYLISPENNYLVTPSHFEGYPLNRSYHSEAIDAALAGDSGFGEYVNYRGQEVIGAYQWLPNLQVGVVAEYEREEALAASNQATFFSILVAVLAASASLATGLFIAVRITQPIGNLTRVTQALAAGDLSQRSNIKERNEIGELGQSFNIMASQLEESLHSLEKSVQEARVATAMAREANRLKSEFLATMSHELRTPLNAIIGFAEIMLSGMSGPISEKQQHKISRIHLNSKRLLDLINDLLDLAKIEAGRVDLVAQAFSPRDLAGTIGAQMESLAEQRGLSFEVHVDPDLPPALVGDVSRIEQAAKNLLSNAFKFTKQGRVAMALHGNGGKSWEIIVVDTGIGIPPHALEYIFDEFRQVDGTSQRAYGGSGLGLAITRNLARIMGGDVRVSSTVGEGSTFSITLPLLVPEELDMVVVR
jgi:signal transduction histidine kinase